MQTVKILSDSTCDLSEELKERFHVEVIPLHVILGKEVYEDGINVTPQEIIAWVDRTKEAPKTAAPAPEEIIGIFQEQLKQYREIVCFSIAAGMSASNASMHIAAKELDAENRIHVIDSANLSSGMGLLVMEAAELAQNGADGKTIAERIETLKPLVRSSFVVDTLMYLYRGGRCSGLTALAGTTLRLHPQISIQNGEMKAGKNYRGSIGRVTMKYVREMEKNLLSAQPKRICITHSPCNKETEKKVYDFLKSLNHFGEICITDAGGVVTSHCGPETLGVFYIESGEKPDVPGAQAK